MPGRERWQGEQEFECSRNSHAAQCLEGIASDHRTVPDIEESDMAWCVSWRGKHFKRADAVPFVQKARRLRFADGIATTQRHLWFSGIKTLIAREKTCVSLTDSNLCIGQGIV